MGFISNIFENYKVMNLITNPFKNQISTNLFLDEICKEFNAVDLESIVIDKNKFDDAKQQMSGKDLDQLINQDLPKLRNTEVEDCNEILYQDGDELKASNEVLAEVLPFKEFQRPRILLPDVNANDLTNTVIDMHAFVNQMRRLSPTNFTETRSVDATQLNTVMRVEPHQPNIDDYNDNGSDDNRGRNMTWYATCCMNTSMILAVIVFLMGISFITYSLFGSKIYH